MKYLALAFLVVAAACGGAKETPDAASTVSADVTLALAISAALAANPASSDSVLAANGLTRDGLDSLLYRIAADSAMSAQYSAGRR